MKFKLISTIFFAYENPVRDEDGNHQSTACTFRSTANGLSTTLG